MDQLVASDASPRAKRSNASDADLLAATRKRIERVRAYISKTTREQYARDYEKRDACEFGLIAVGAALAELKECRSFFSFIGSDFIRLGARLEADYAGSLPPDLSWNAASNGLPYLAEQLERYALLQAGSAFLSQELSDALNQAIVGIKPAGEEEHPDTRMLEDVLAKVTAAQAQEIRALVAEGSSSGSAISAEDVFAHLKDRFRLWGGWLHSESSK